MPQNFLIPNFAMNTLSSYSEAQRILIVIPDLATGGGERVTRELIEVLGSRGFSIRLVANVPDEIRSQLPLASYRKLDWSRRIKRFTIIAQELFRCGEKTRVLTVLTGPIIAVGLLNFFFGRIVVAHEHSDIEQLYLIMVFLKHS